MTKKYPDFYSNPAPTGDSRIMLAIEGLTIQAGPKKILNSFSLNVLQGEILAIIGPSGSGKSTLLRALNRLTDLDDGIKVKGKIYLSGESIVNHSSAPAIRSQIGIVFPVPTPLPLSIFENIAFGPKLNGVKDSAALTKIVENCLKSAYLWDEVKERLSESALKLSGGQQQRLCLARTLALKPKVLLLDEPCSGLDPISTAQIEEALQRLKKDMAIILVTNNVKQASRVSEKTAFLLMGELVEYDNTQKLFTNPKDPRTEAYITGRFG